MLDQNQMTADIDAAAAQLLGAPLIAATPATGGGNNRVYKAETRDGVYAIKFYPRQTADPRDRLGQEFAALTLLGNCGIAGVPRAFACAPALGCAAYEWVDGHAPGSIGDADVDAMSALAKAVASIDAGMASAIAAASASCFSGADVTAQFSDRLSRLRGATDDARLHAFLDRRQAPAFETFETRARKAYAAAGLDFEAPITGHARTLSPSDFGFHNALRRADDSLVFLDFEYFGWDDPAKMIADAIWHPGSAIHDDAAGRFECTMLDFFAAREGETLRTRYNALSPLFGMIWCLIVLNEFLPERWARRVAAGNAEDAMDARTRKLLAAEALFTRVIERYDD